MNEEETASFLKDLHALEIIFEFIVLTLDFIYNPNMFLDVIRINVWTLEVLRSFSVSSRLVVFIDNF